MGQELPSPTMLAARRLTQVAAVLHRDGPLAEPWFVQSNSAILAIFSSSAHGSAMCRAATFAIAPRFSFRAAALKPE
jgi:hypothetical protein